MKEGIVVFFGNEKYKGEYINKADLMDKMMADCNPEHIPNVTAKDVFTCAIASVEVAPAATLCPVVHGHWEDISETEIPLQGMMTPITNTAETCSVCKVRVGFVGPKRYLFDKQCPNCGAFMDEIV